jgi:lysine 2,3-aminomutase
MTAVSKTLRTISELAASQLIEIDALPELQEVAARYAVAITPAMAQLIDISDPHDPIAKQFVPDPAESHSHPEERADPIGDDAHSPVEGIVHRYQDRVLLKLVHVCPIYCRFCFRREMVGPGKRPALSAKALMAALNYIRQHQEIWEVILTGGDPLILSPRRLREVMRALAAIEHVKIVRVHTRVPAVAPERITRTLINALCIEGMATYVVLHANHARELTPAARQACARIIDAGIPMLSQTVLLKGVNDDAETLSTLMRCFVENRIKPYYLHHADLAPGTAHLRTGIAEGQRLMRAMRSRTSGLCQPTYVLDIPGGAGKVPIGPQYLSDACDGASEGSHYEVTDERGAVHVYPPA